MTLQIALSFLSLAANYFDWYSTQDSFDDLIAASMASYFYFDQELEFAEEVNFSIRGFRHHSGRIDRSYHCCRRHHPWLEMVLVLLSDYDSLFKPSLS